MSRFLQEFLLLPFKFLIALMAFVIMWVRGDLKGLGRKG
jgi:hypothetical protein